jgi:hypothetical protein
MPPADRTSASEIDPISILMSKSSLRALAMFKGSTTAPSDR